MRIDWDKFGIATSLACAIHCAVLPIFLSTLPFFGINIIHNRWFEAGMILLTAIIGYLALRHGWRSHHQRYLPMLLFAGGIVLLIAKQLFVNWHIWLLVPAVILIVSAHWVNYQICRSNQSCEGSCVHQVQGES